MTMKTIRVTTWQDVPEYFTGCVLMEGLTVWLQNGILHREDGPAIEWRGGRKSYHVLDQDLSQKQFEIFQVMWESTLLKKTNDLMKSFIELAKIK